MTFEVHHRASSLLALLAALYLPGCADDQRDWTPALQELRTDRQVKDLVVENGSLYVGVLDNGTRRDGFAMYACEVLRTHDVAGAWIYVVDVRDITRKLGRHHCR